MKKINYTFVIILTLAISLSNAVHAQVSINSNGNNADASSMLDVSSSSHGLLIPRMTLSERGNIDLTGSPTGLMIYQTDNTPGFYYYDGSSWTAIQGGNDNDWTVSGNNMYSAVSGNVGIGTDSPSGIFHVHQPLTFENETLDQQQTAGSSSLDVTSSLWQSFTAGASGYLSKIELWDAGTSVGTFTMKIYSGEGTGGTLLGTSNSVSRNNSGWEYVSFTFPTPISISSSQQYTFALVFGTIWTADFKGGAYTGGICHYDLTTSSWNDTRFKTYLASIDNYPVSFIVKDDGNVGIGTTSPSQKLEVDGAVKIGAYTLPSADGSNGQLLKTDGSGNISWSNDDNTVLWTENSGDVYRNSGNVGIGTTSPSQKLEVDGAVKIGAYTLPSADGSNGQLLKTDGSGNISWSNDDNTVLWTENSGNVYRNSGNVGIGTTTPSCPLEVNGSASLTATYGYLNSSGQTGTTGPQSNGYSIKASHRIMATEFNAVSDRRIKTNIKVSNNISDLQKIVNLKVSEYNYIDSIGKGNTLQKGFIAQEVEQFIPEAVNIHSDFIPDVFTLANNLTKTENIVTIELPKTHHLSQGDLIRLITPMGQVDKEVLEIVSDNSFSVSMTEEPESIFVYGKKVDDFRVVNYDYIFSTGIGAIQELSNRVDELESKVKQIDKLTAEVEVLKSLIIQENNLAAKTVMK